jgi:CRISPR type I-E-associated protein CasB/Cse2
MSEPRIDPRVTEFCQRLDRLEAGERARLKRNAGRSLAESHYVLGLFFRLLPPNVPRFQEESFFLLATLFPLADGGAPGNLGTSLADLRDRANPQGLDRRVEVLLDADRDQLRFRLRQAVRFLESKGGTANWPQLLQDILRWDHPKRYVQEQWARSYFAGQ